MLNGNLRMTLGSPVQLVIEMSAGVISELCSAQDDRMNIIVSLAVTSYRGADKSLARPGGKQTTATEDFDVHISYL